MPRHPIPERAPVADLFTGMILQSGQKQALALVSQPDAKTIASGTFIIRYGVRYLGRPHLSIVPGLIALDYGDMLTGEEAWEFLLKRSNLYPRADVVGYRNDGKDEMIPIKWLDLAQPVEVLVYPDAKAAVPSARPLALIGDSDALSAAVPSRLFEYLPCYLSVTEWKAQFDE